LGNEIEAGSLFVSAAFPGTAYLRERPWVEPMLDAVRRHPVHDLPVHSFILNSLVFVAWAVIRDDPADI
jgi:hypothetical protein